MTKMKIVRVGTQLVASLALLSLDVVLFYIMDFNLNQSYYQEEKPLIAHQTANGHGVSKVSSRQQPTKELDRAQEVSDMSNRKQPPKAQGNGQKVTNRPMKNDQKDSSHAANNDGSMSNTHRWNQLSKPPGSTRNVSYPTSMKQLSQYPNTGVHVSHLPSRNQSPNSQIRGHRLSNSPDRNNLDNIPLSSTISESKVLQNVSNINERGRERKEVLI